MARSHGLCKVTVPQIMSHRGDLRSHPENSIAALESPLAAGVRHLECDLQINGSGTPVLLHDDNALRTYGVDCSVFDHVDGQLPTLPTMTDVLKLADQYPKSTFYLEIKHNSLDHWGEMFVMDRLLPWSKQLRKHFIFARSTSFLSLARQTGLPNIGVIIRDWSTATRKRMDQLQPEFLIVNIKRVPHEEKLWPGPWKWAVYEVGDIPTALHWGGRGADFILSHFSVDLINSPS